MNEHTLSQRLERVAAHIPAGARLADIGSDHAYLPVALMHRGAIAAAVAGEVAATPFHAANRTVADNGLAQHITVRRADGLAAIQSGDDITAISLCGMGGETIRDILDSGCVAIVAQVPELAGVLTALAAPPRMVVTDSQAFAEVRAIVPRGVELTSFSILFARYKGDFDVLRAGVDALDRLKDGDKVLIVEGCTHRRQCDDIGTVKIPRWLRNYTQKDIRIETASGRDFPDDLSGYALVIHCGGCMLNGREVQYRMKCAADQQVPITNYGIAIAYMQGILKRSLSVFPYLQSLV